LVIAHIHVPKCAGTSFRILLERHFGQAHRNLYINDTYFVYGEAELSRCLCEPPAVRSFSSHHVRAFPERIDGRTMLYVTFLRDPAEQFVSYMTHARKHYATITSRSLLEALPPNAPALGLREFARWLLSNDRDIPFRENHNVNFFSRHSSSGETNRLAAAKAALERFYFVGVTERMEESVRRLQAKARMAGVEFPMDAVGLENTSREYRDDLTWIDPADEVGAMLLRSVTEDRQLYEWVVQRMDGDWQAALAALEWAYRDRPDLQQAFPEAADGDLRRLTSWARRIATGEWRDDRAAALQPFAAWFALWELYDSRPDLQQAFPEAADRDFHRVMTWAAGVAHGACLDSAMTRLQPFAGWLDTAAVSGTNRSDRAAQDTLRQGIICD
jgi:hypothetical protein